MSILNGFKKARAYKKTDDGYIWESRDVHGETVYFNDNDTAEIKLGAINGITSDPSAEADDIAASAALVKQLNDSLGNISFIPDYDNVIDLTNHFTDVGQTYTVPSNGYIYIYADCTGVGARRLIINNINILCIGKYLERDEEFVSYAPVSKGNILSVNSWTGTYSNFYLAFIPNKHD